MAKDRWLYKGISADIIKKAFEDFGAGAVIIIDGRVFEITGPGEIAGRSKGQKDIAEIAHNLSRAWWFAWWDNSQGDEREKPDLFGNSKYGAIIMEMENSFEDLSQKPERRQKRNLPTEFARTYEEAARGEGKGAPHITGEFVKTYGKG